MHSEVPSERKEKVKERELGILLNTMDMATEKDTEELGKETTKEDIKAQAKEERKEKEKERLILKQKVKDGTTGLIGLLRRKARTTTKDEEKKKEGETLIQMEMRE